MSLALTLMMVAQDGGRTATDTKLDLVIDPIRFLRQALSMWDPLGDAGRVQNQAYGYLFPMGPFFAVARWFDIPPWAAQRLWEAALVVGAFLGTYCVARALGVRRFWPAAAAGLAFALTPRVLSEITANSAELLPTMVLPWVLLPLVRGAERGSPRRAAALSAVALLFAGAANGGATAAILPVPLLWILTRSGGARRRALLGWTLLSYALASIWWVVPLLVFGRYSPPFVDWIEGAANTTGTTSLFAGLRGATHWVTYLGESWWPAGWDYASDPVTVATTAAVAAAGLAGLARRQTPHRLFLCASLGLGLVAVTFGHPAEVGPPFDSVERELLDGPFVAFRNVHKFQGWVTLPIAVGLGFFFDGLRTPARRTVRVGDRAIGVSLRPLALAAIVGVSAVAVGPALGNRLVSASRSDAIAGWWDGAARWLANNGDGSSALIAPGAPFPTYLWGETVDDAMQPVARSPWIVRSAIPLSQAGQIRLLDVVEERLAAGRADPSLAPLLSRAGIGFVVVRHDLDASASEATAQSLVRLTLETSPGIERAVGIGPRIGEPGGRGYVIDGGAGGPRPAIEIFAVTPNPGRVALLGAEGAIRSNGSTDALASLVDGGLPATTAVLFGSDGDDFDAAGTVAVATDGVRRQQDGFGGPFRKSPTLTATEPYSGERAVWDYLPDGVGELSTYRYLGIADVRVSSSIADVITVQHADPAAGPWAALDADPRTAWRSASWTGAVGQWIELRFNEPVDVDWFQVAFAPEFGPFPTQLELTTDTASSVAAVRPAHFKQTVAMPEGPTRTLRLTVRAVEGGGSGISFGVAGLYVPGIDPQRTLDVPISGSPATIRFAVAPGYRSDCVAVTGGVACDPNWGARGEEDAALDRSIDITEARAYEVSVTVRVAPGPALNRLLDAGRAVQATATSVTSPDPRVRPGAAVDGDPLTAWVASPTDEQPALTLRLGEPARIRALRLVTDGRTPVARPTTVWVRAGDVDWIGDVPRDGLIRLPSEAITDKLVITVAETEERQSISRQGRSVQSLPVGISEVRLDPAAAATNVAGDVTLDCGSGLAVVIDGKPVRLAASAPRGVALAGGPIAATPCDEPTVSLDEGQHRFTLAATPLAAPVSLTFTTPEFAAAGSAAGTADVLQWGATNRRVRVDTEATSILVVHENFNDGWTARLDGRALDSARVDGWLQGFVIPGGAAGVVELTYGPQRVFVAGLAAGVAGVVAVLALAVGGPRRQAPDAAVERSIRPSTAIGLTVLLGFLLTGPVGAATIAAVLVVFGPPFRRNDSLRSLSGPLLLVAAGLIVAAAPSVIYEPSTPVVQTLCVLAVALTFVAGIPPPTRESRRSDGRSTRNHDAVAQAAAPVTVRTSSVPKRPENGV